MIAKKKLMATSKNALNRKTKGAMFTFFSAIRSKIIWIIERMNYCAIIVCGIILLFIYCVSIKETSMYPVDDLNYTLLRYKGAGITDDMGLFGYYSVEFIIPLYKAYNFMDVNILDTRKIKIIKVIDVDATRGEPFYTATCFIEDCFPNGTIRAKGEGEVGFFLRSKSCGDVKYKDFTFFDNCGKEISNIKNGHGNEVFLDNSNNILYSAEYVNFLPQKVVYKDAAGNILYEGSPLMPMETQKRLIDIYNHN